jgi:hypothetical protein
MPPDRIPVNVELFGEAIKAHASAAEAFNSGPFLMAANSAAIRWRKLPFFPVRRIALWQFQKPLRCEKL